ncbi:hypothetical protein J6590_003244 [Homalodisca vitripennis]|nr:hypothetical protein J6590_003244 [Homalodisca vitripennis]
MNYSFAVVLCVSESVKDIFRLHACLQDSSLFPTLTDHNLALNNSRLRLGTSHENKDLTTGIRSPCPSEEMHQDQHSRVQ